MLAKHAAPCISHHASDECWANHSWRCSTEHSKAVLEALMPCLGVPAHLCGEHKHGSTLRHSRSLGSALTPDEPRAFYAGLQVRAIKALRSRFALLRELFWTEARLSHLTACHAVHLCARQA